MAEQQNDIATEKRHYLIFLIDHISRWKIAHTNAFTWISRLYFNLCLPFTPINIENSKIKFYEMNDDHFGLKIYTRRQIHKKCPNRTHAAETCDFQSTIQLKLLFYAHRSQCIIEIWSQMNFRNSMDIQCNRIYLLTAATLTVDLQQNKFCKEILADSQKYLLFFFCVQSIRHWRIKYDVES